MSIQRRKGGTPDKTQTKKETCRKTWEQEKNQGWKCPNDECKGTFRNKKN